MKTFKETSYGDMTGQTFDGMGILVAKKDLTTLDGSPKIVKGFFGCQDNFLKDLQGSPVKVYHKFNCSGNPNLTTFKGNLKECEEFVCFNIGINDLDEIKKEIFINQIKAKSYITSFSTFKFFEIEEQFEAYRLGKYVKSKGFRTLLGLKNERL